MVAQVASAASMNADVKKQEAHFEAKASFDLAATTAKLASVALEEARAGQLALVSASDMVSGGALEIRGLSVTNEGDITLMGVPYDQCSGMERLRLAIIVATRSEKRLKLVCVDEGDGLDAEHLAELSRIAELMGCDVMMTSIWADPPDGADRVVLNDGCVVTEGRNNGL